MKIWLDDQFDDENTPARKAPDGFTAVHSVNEAIKLIENAEHNNEPVEMVDIDNDLGPYAYDGGDGNKLIWWMVERNTMYPVNIHSKNIVERENMLRTIKKYWKNN